MENTQFGGKKKNKKKPTQRALAGNRTRASRVAGENSTTEPPMLDKLFACKTLLSVDRYN